MQRVMGRKRKVCPERVLEELAAIGFSKVTDFLSIENGTLVVKETDQLQLQNRAAIASVERMSNGSLKLKFYDKMKALELLGKHMGLFDGKPEEKQEYNNLLEAILAATREELDIHDVPEIQQASDASDDMVE